jgi:predicted transcriptional regulator of viral defense system
MEKNYYFGPVEQEILDLTADVEPIVAEDLVEVMEGTRPQVVRNALSSLVKKGRLFRLKRGIYLRCDPSGEPIIVEPERLGLALFTGYIAFTTALHHWRLIEYIPFTIFVATRNRSAERELGAYVFKAVSMGTRAQGAVFDNGVYVSTLEKTIYDCIYKPAHSGGYNIVVRAIAESEPDWRKVMRWFDLLGTPSLRNRAGFLLEKAGNAPKWLLTELRTDLNYNIWLDPSAVRKGSTSKDWMVIDNVGGWDAIG